MQVLTLNVAVDGSVLVQQSFMPYGRRIMSYTFTLAELDTWGAEDATRYVGALTLAALSAEWKILQRYPYFHLLPGESNRYLTHVHFDSTPTRLAHLGTSIATGPDRLLVHRCAQPTTADRTVSTLPLAWLLHAGRDQATYTLGNALLRELVVLHPDVFAPFPALATSPAGTFDPD